MHLDPALHPDHLIPPDPAAPVPPPVPPVAALVDTAVQPLATPSPPAVLPAAPDTSAEAARFGAVANPPVASLPVFADPANTAVEGTAPVPAVPVNPGDVPVEELPVVGSVVLWHHWDPVARADVDEPVLVVAHARDAAGVLMGISVMAGNVLPAISPADLHSE